jgi:hypothetical protein
MAITVRKAVLWRGELKNRPGALAGVLEPLAEAGSDLRVAMGYGLPTDPEKAVVELFPISGKKATAAASAAGLAASNVPCLLVEGGDRPGLGARMARAVADQGVNISFVLAESVGRKFSAVFGFASDADADKASRAIRAAAKPAPRAAAKPASRAKRRRR